MTAPAPGASGPRPRRAARRALVAAAALCASLLAAESAVRLGLRAAGRPHSGAETRERLLGIRTWMDRHRAYEQGLRGIAGAGGGRPVIDVLSPYVGADINTALEHYVHTARYFQGEEARRGLDVLLLGGSVAAGIGHVLHPALVEALRADSRLGEREVRVHAEARPGFKQPQQMILLALLLDLGWQPDLVIEIDGFNELAIGNENRAKGRHPIYPAPMPWERLVRGPSQGDGDLDLAAEMARARDAARRAAGAALRLGAHHSALASWAAETCIERGRRRYLAALQTYRRAAAPPWLERTLRGPAPPRDLEAALDLVVECWVEASVSLDAMCAERGIAYVHVLQPTLHDAGSKPLTPAEIRVSSAIESWVEGTRAGYPRLREAGERLRQRGVAFFDASRLFAGVRETLYYDACHFGHEGLAALARFTAEKARAVLPAAASGEPLPEQGHEADR